MERKLVGVCERAVSVQTLERFGDRGVKKPSPRLSQLRVDDLLQQWVRKIVADSIDASRLNEDPLRE
jgi:hypothetical protein